MKYTVLPLGIVPVIFTVSVILVGWTEALATNACAAARPDSVLPLPVVVALPLAVVPLELTLDLLLLLHAAASMTIDTTRPDRQTRPADARAGASECCTR